MAQATKNRSAGEAVLAKAIADRERWQGALEEAEADAVVVNAMVPDSPERLSDVGERTVAARGRLDAAGRGLERAVQQEAEARRGLLHHIADDLAADRSQVDREAHALSRKLEPLLRSLRDLDEVDYGPTPMATLPDGRTVLASEADLVQHGTFTVQVSRRSRLAAQIRELMVREAVLRYVAERGDSPQKGRDLLGTTPCHDEEALARAGLAGIIGGWEVPPVPDEAVAYLTWLRADQAATGEA